MTSTLENDALFAQRLAVRLSADPTCGAIAVGSVVAAFHRLIQARGLDEVMIDVADYSHVPDGPGIVLVCHGANYSLTLRGQRPGLLYQRKRPNEGDFAARLDRAVRATVRAARALQDDPELRGKLRFVETEIEVGANDRLLAPCTAETLTELRPALTTVAERLWPGGVELDFQADARAAFRVRLKRGARPITEIPCKP